MTLAKTLTTLILVAAALVGCSGADSGGKYVGKWADKKPFWTSFEVRRNDSQYIVDVVYRDFLDGKTKTLTAPATIKDGMLHVDFGDPLMGASDFAVDDKTGKLVGKGLSLDKVS